MAARAIWKGILTLEAIDIPVKLYSAVEDRNVRFRLLHSRDSQPVRQALVNPESGKIIPFSETRRAYQTDEGARVMFSHDALETARPEKSRTISLLSFLPYESIDHRWYDPALFPGSGRRRRALHGTHRGPGEYKA